VFGIWSLMGIVTLRDLPLVTNAVDTKTEIWLCSDLEQSTLTANKAKIKAPPKIFAKLYMYTCITLFAYPW